MNIALVGSSGYIAGFLQQRFEKTGINRVLKIDCTKSADEYLNLQEPWKFNYACLDEIDVIIFTAAISGPDKCASDFDYCWSINVTGTVYFIREAMKHKCRVLFFSTDAVFGDVPGMIYNEKSKTHGETPYGRMKKAVEDEFKGEENFKAIRLSYVVSEKDRFVSYCLKCIDSGDTAEVFHPFYRNVIIISDVIDVVQWFIMHWNEYKLQVLCVAGKELVSRVRIADELNRIYGGRLKYTISFPGEQFYKNRAKITQMQSLYIHKIGIIPDNTFTEKLQRQLEGMRI